jgi:hypothetical protein
VSSALISGFWHERSTTPTHQSAVEHLPLTQAARTRFASTAPFPLELTVARGSEKACGNSRHKPSIKADNNAGGNARGFGFDQVFGPNVVRPSPISAQSNTYLSLKQRTHASPQPPHSRWSLRSPVVPKRHAATHVISPVLRLTITLAATHVVSGLIGPGCARSAKRKRVGRVWIIGLGGGRTRIVIAVRP